MKSAMQVARRLAPGVGLAVALAVAGCKGNGMMGGGSSSDMAASAGGSAALNSGASNLRTGLNTLLQEHVVLASAATDAALGGRSDEFKAAADALDANSQEIAGAIGSVYGADAQSAFLPLWRKHIGFVVDYTTGVATHDQAKADKAVQDLLQYTQDFGAFLDGATGGRLKKDAVAELVKAHVVGLKGVIDAQAAKDWPTAYTKERDAEKHMSTIANALAGAIVDQFPGKF